MHAKGDPLTLCQFRIMFYQASEGMGLSNTEFGLHLRIGVMAANIYLPPDII